MRTFEALRILEIAEGVAGPVGGPERSGEARS